MVINNTNFQFYEIFPDKEIPIVFTHNPVAPDDVMQSKYTSSLYQGKELSVMNLGHGRAGHLPDYSFIRYRYLPAWGDYQEIVKDNPAEYWKAFGQMIYAMQYLRGENALFEKEHYAEDVLQPYKEEIWEILTKRQLIACDDWKAFGEKLSGCEIPEFDVEQYQNDYITATKETQSETFLGRFILAALAQKSMVTNRIFVSGNLLAGISIDFQKKGIRGIQDYFSLVEEARREMNS